MFFFLLYALISSLSISFISVFGFYLNLVPCLSFDRSIYKIWNGNKIGILVLWYHVWYVWCTSGLACILFPSSGCVNGCLFGLVMELVMCLV